ncbi:MAG TPA: Glu/Leu/Phe/Val dehydrogenase dimerization domain-containing protein [Terriglobales bacterium]|nr:Glu/Leu/Phe/Val dehydrogenase dimerization domain-containing protein [Terriglobales bacterium]
MASLVSEVFAGDASSALEAAQELEQTARFLDLEKWIVQRLRHSERESQLHSQIITDDGQPRIVRALRVQHSSVRGPGMGPLLFSKNLSASDVHAIAMNLTWQWALWKLPLSGSAGLISSDLNELSEREARLLTRCYATEMPALFGSQTDVTTPARDSHPQIMAWAMAALGPSESRSTSIVGKPISMGGVDRAGLAARFLRTLFALVMKQFGLAAKGACIAILGFDETARRIALELERTGTRVVAIADHSGGVCDPAGLNVGLLIQHAEKEQVLFGYPEAKPISMEDLLQLKSDALLLCCEDLGQPATAGVVFESGAKVNCVLPGKTSVIPSLLADFGLQFASFCEWRKNSWGAFSEMESLRGMPLYVRNVWQEVWDYAQRHELTVKEAALTLAVSRMAEAMRMA